MDILSWFSLSLNQKDLDFNLLNELLVNYIDTW